MGVTSTGGGSRRHWLLAGLRTGMVVTIGALLYPIARFLRPRPATTGGASEIVAPYTVSQLHPDAEGHWPAPFNFGGKPCLVILTPDKEVRAFNAICTHADCTVEYRSDRAEIFCACHNGRYDLNGKNISGPPPRPLQEYKVTLRGNPGQEEIVVSRNA